MMIPKKNLFVFLSLFSLIFLKSGFATSVLPMKLSQMESRAEKIFTGRCLSVEEELDENGLQATYVRFEVTKAVKGVEDGEIVLVKIFGTRRPLPPVAEGESVMVPMRSVSFAAGGYEVNSTYRLYLYPESELGFTSPVGGGQGKFLVSP